MTAFMRKISRSLVEVIETFPELKHTFRIYAFQNSIANGFAALHCPFNMD